MIPALLIELYWLSQNGDWPGLTLERIEIRLPSGERLEIRWTA